MFDSKDKDAMYYYIAKMFLISGVINICLSKLVKGMDIFSMLKLKDSQLTIFYVILLGVTIWVSFKRETYLPFLGSCVLPEHVILSQTNPPKGDNLVTVTVDAPNSESIIWWAAEPTTDDKVINNPKTAYNHYTNSGVVPVKDDKATIILRCPQKYKVPIKGLLNKHLHYRKVYNNGMLSPVETVYLDC